MKTLREYIDLIESAQTVTEISRERAEAREEELYAIEKIKKSDHSDVVKKYLIALCDPDGPVFDAIWRGHTNKEKKATEQIRNAFAQKYNISPEELENSEKIEWERINDGTSIHNIPEDVTDEAVAKVESLFKNK